MPLSVLICTYNRHELLAQSLRALIQETVAKPEQVVVVNGGGERADEVVRSYMGVPGVQVKLVKTVNKNLAASRNVGLPHCTGDIIAMTDDDALVFPDWVTQMKRAHAQHPEAGAVGGPVLGTNTDSLVGKVADLITFPAWPEPRYVRTLPGVNISYKREVVEQIGLQDETLFRGEDVDYNWRVKKLGYEIYFDPAIKVRHHHRPTLRGLLNQHYMYGRAYYLVRRKWPDMYCIYPHGFRRPKDYVKAAHSLALPFYQPFLSARRLSNWMDRLRALPILFAVGLAWEYGMLI
ncbi:MAG TPA: glycosyltransferase, partial [Gammaproteobacteria bacterium]|nr:glycosyltransferase [Gammaproteobacteria bacterium]